MINPHREASQASGVHSRRSFLLGSVAAAAAIVGSAVAGDWLQAAQPAAGAASRFSPAAGDAFTSRLVGPIFSNPCPFKANLELDHDAARKAIARALAHGIHIFACTAGNTKYNTLNLDEVRQVNRTMIEAARRHTEPALTIAATGDWSTEDAVEFARFAESCGADALQVLLPRRAADDEDAAFQHFQAVASSTRLPLVLHGRFSESLLRRLVQIDQIRAMKEDHSLEDLIRQQVDFGQRLVIFGGGAENRFLVGRPYGMRAYYSTYSTFAPDIAMQFWNAIRAGDEPQAVKITLKHDYPFIRRFSHPFWHATLEYFGIGTRHIRPPFKAFTDEQMQEVKAFFDAQGLGPQRYLD